MVKGLTLFYKTKLTTGKFFIRTQTKYIKIENQNQPVVMSVFLKTTSFQLKMTALRSNHTVILLVDTSMVAGFIDFHTYFHTW